jgi:hypothetical protein
MGEFYIYTKGIYPGSTDFGWIILYTHMNGREEFKKTGHSSIYLAWTHLIQKIVVYRIVLLPGEEVGKWIKNDFFCSVSDYGHISSGQWTTMGLPLSSLKVKQTGQSNNSMIDRYTEYLWTPVQTSPVAYSSIQAHLFKKLRNLTPPIILKVKKT